MSARTAFWTSSNEARPLAEGGEAQQVHAGPVVNLDEDHQYAFARPAADGRPPMALPSTASIKWPGGTRPAFSAALGACGGIRSKQAS
jgi:hypothetical protein